MTFYLHPYPYRRAARRWSENNQNALGVNVHEAEDTYLLSALVPGLKAEDLNIQILDDVLRIEVSIRLMKTSTFCANYLAVHSRGPCACLPPLKRILSRRKFRRAS